MRLKLNLFILFALNIFLINLIICPVRAQEEIVRAKIGIQIRSDDQIVSAKSQDDLNIDDLIRIYVHPEKMGYVYVIHTDLKDATLLNMIQQKIQSSTLVMPSLREFYQIDGKSAHETFTIIISPDELAEVLKIFKDGSTTYNKWNKVEEPLVKKSKIDLSQLIDKPFSISGNVRSVKGSSNLDPFVNELQIYSGKSILVKRYEFKVKK